MPALLVESVSLDNPIAFGDMIRKVNAHMIENHDIPFFLRFYRV